ncbi:MAG TPA: Rrf2 family transcriptional regulator [Dehalococcoidia bacterium]|nr:Rrf2 family transcriptional regulator [Dehalococcoidia bacterium]
MSDGVEWGIHCSVLLASLPPGSVLSGSALAEFHGVSESYLLKHLKALAKAGILASIPGVKGGFRLNRTPDAISVLDIVTAIEGDAPAFRCTEIRQRGPASVEPEAYRSPCPINAVMLQAERAWKEVLASQTIADLVANVGRNTDPRSVPKAAVWLEENLRR